MGGVKVSLSIKSCNRRSHEASPPRSLIMGRSSSNLSMQYVFLLLIVVATTTQAYLLSKASVSRFAQKEENGYQDRRNGSHHDARKITETQQPRYLKVTRKKVSFSIVFSKKIQIFVKLKHKNILNSGLLRFLSIFFLNLSFSGTPYISEIPHNTVPFL